MFTSPRKPWGGTLSGGDGFPIARVSGGGNSPCTVSCGGDLFSHPSENYPFFAPLTLIFPRHIHPLCSGQVVDPHAAVEIGPVGIQSQSSNAPVSDSSEVKPLCGSIDVVCHPDPVVRIRNRAGSVNTRASSLILTSPFTSSLAPGRPPSFRSPRYPVCD